MNALLKDVRFAIRNLWQRPTFAAVAVGTIALGIGATTAIFSVVNAVLIKDLPFEEPDRLVQVWSSNTERGIARGFMSPPDIADYQARNRTFVDLAAYSEAELALIDTEGSAVKATGTWAGDNLFSVLGVRPLLGRTFTPEDGGAGAPKVVVLGHDFWQDRFGGDENVLGTSITVENDAYAIVGIMPPGFDFPAQSNFWLNRYLLSYPGRYARWMDVVGRIQPGVDIEAARSDLANIAGQLQVEYPDWNRAYGTTVITLHESVAGDTRSALLVLLGATAFLMLIVCVNVINLLLARMADRGREIALRTALGAGRLRLGRQLLTESLVLAVAGAAVGVVLAVLGVEALLTLGPANLPRLDEVSVDGGVLLYVTAITIVTGLAFGMAPVFRLARTDVQLVLQDASKGSTVGLGRERIRNLLVTTEIALAVMLVIGAGLLVKSYSLLIETDPGFNATGILTFQLDLPTASYRDLPDVSEYHRNMTERLGNISGVTSVAGTATLPFDPEVPFLGNFLINGRPPPREGEEPRAHYRQVTPDYFRTMGIGLVSGREFTSLDHGDAPGAVIVNEALARRYFPDKEPIGEVIEGLPPHLALGGFLVDQFQIVGVVRDVKYSGLAETSEPSLYLPVAQAPFRRMSFTLRTTADPISLMTQVRGEVAGVDPIVPLSRIETMERLLSTSVARERFSMLLLGLFAFVALLLAAVGIYGVISYSIAQRTAELGIRMAVGADGGDVLKLVMRQGVRLATWGVGAGLFGAVMLTRVMASQLYGVSVRDPLIFLSVALVLGLVALLATYLPALRASRIEPVLALQGGRR